MYCIYNFFGEAIQVANKALDTGKLTNMEHSSVKKAILDWNKKEQYYTKSINNRLKKSNYNVWAQYISVPYPSF